MTTVLSELFPPKLRALVYVVSAMISSAYAVIEANTNLHWGWLAALAAWNTFAGLLAASNTATVTNLELLDAQRDLEVASQLRATADAEYGDGGTP